MNIPGEFELMLKRQQERAQERLAADPDNRIALLLMQNREQAIADLEASNAEGPVCFLKKDHPMPAASILQIQDRVKTLIGEHDTDQDGQDRFTPPGSIGVLMDENLPGQWSVQFGDAAVYIEDSELRDPALYELLAPTPIL